MNVGVLTMVSQASQEGPSTGDVVGAVWLGLIIIFFIAVIVTGFTAKKINNISNATYSKAFVAQFLIGPLSMAALAIFGLYFEAPFIVSVAVAYSLIPIFIYKVVFSSMWREAALIWVVVTVVMSGVIYLMTLLGLISFAAFSGG